jgi:hypothetical protein
MRQGLFDGLGQRVQPLQGLLQQQFHRRECVGQACYPMRGGAS